MEIRREGEREVRVTVEGGRGGTEKRREGE
jgi:hypothetical protein